MRIALFTSTHTRHKYVAAQIALKCDLQLIITEAKSSRIEDTTSYTKLDKDLLQHHFKEREETERIFFGDFSTFPKDIRLLQLENGGINTVKTLDILKKQEIDAIVLFGTSIIKSIILDVYPKHIVNLHLGLSPYYKGSGTNFFPIAQGDFECLGATIHLATASVDAGAILHQVRLDNLTPQDTIHTIGNKIIQQAGAVLPSVVNSYLRGEIEAVAQPPSRDTQEYRIKDFTPEILRKAHRLLREGGIALYLKESLSRKRNKPIISSHNA